MATLSITQADDIGISSRKRHRQLLPGIPDEITLHEISTKLPWKVFSILSAVSRSWGHAIRSREVYDARVLSQSTESFVIVNRKCFLGGMALRSTRENSLVKLPRIMHRSQLVVPFDGRIYILGREEYNFATRKLHDNDSVVSKEVYDSTISDEMFVLDVAAGERRWRKCASMSEGHLGRIDHLLFMAQGKLHTIHNSGIDLYNAEENSWTELHSFSSIEPGDAVWMGDEHTAVVHMDDELIIKYWVFNWVEARINFYDNNFPYKEKFCVAKSNGFGGENKEIVWQKVLSTNSPAYSSPFPSTRELTSILL